MPLMGRGQAQINTNAETDTSSAAANAGVQGQIAGWNPAEQAVAAPVYSGNEGAGGTEPVTPEPTPQPEQRRQTKQTEEKKKEAKKEEEAPQQYFQKPNMDDMVMEEEAEPQQIGVQNLSNEQQAAGSDFDIMTPEQRRKFNNEMDWGREEEDWNIYGDIPQSFPWRNADGSYKEGFGPQHSTVPPVGAPTFRRRTKPQGEVRETRFNAISDMWEYPDENGRMPGESGYIPPEETAPQNIADTGGIPVRGRDDIEFATNGANTAVTTDGEILEGQHVPPPPGSAYLDEIPEAPEEQLDVSDWLAEHREFTAQPQERLDEALRRIDPNTYEALKQFSETGVVTDPNQGEALLNGYLQADMEYQEYVMKDYLVGHLNVEGQYIEQLSGNSGWVVRNDPEVARAKAGFAAIAGLDPVMDSALIDRWVRLAINFTKDNEGKMFDQQKSPNAPMFKSTYIAALQMMGESWKRKGHPFAFTEMNKRNVPGFSDPRFPVAVIDMESAQAISRATGRPAEEIIEHARQDMRKTYKMVCRYASNTGDQQLRRAWENQVRAMVNLCGYDIAEWYVPEVGDNGLGFEMTCDAMFTDWMKNDDPDVESAMEDRTDRALERAMNQKRHKGAHMENGKIVQGKMVSASNQVLNIISVFHIVGDVRLLLTGLLEHGLGDIEARSASWWLTDEAHKKTKWLRDFENDPLQAERIQAAQMLFRAGEGFDFVHLFADSGEPWTLENAQKFILSNNPEVPETKLKKAQQWINDHTETLQTGGYSWSTQDSKTFMSCLLAELSQNGGATSQQIAEGFQTNPDKFMSFLMKQDTGKQAMVGMTNMYAARISPASEVVQNYLKAHGIGNAALSAILGSPFITYGVRAFELITPFSNTLSWLATKALKNSEKFQASDLSEVQLGGISEKGWKKALMFDMVKLGQTSAFCLVAATAVAMSGGIEPPDDDDKFLLPWEWKIHVPWSEVPIPMKQSWFMDDLFQWSMPLAISLNYIHQTADVKGAGDIFWNGFNDIFDTNKVMKCFWAVADLPKTMEKLGAAAGDPTSAFLGKLIDIADYITSPMGIYQFQDALHADELQRDSRYYLDENGKEVYRKSDIERMYSKAAEHNGLLALLGNLASAATGSGMSRFGRYNEGYKYDPDERDVSIAGENSYQTWLKKHEGVEDNDIAKRMYAAEKCNEVLQFKDSVDAAQHRFILDQEDAQIVKDYIFESLDGVSDKLIDLKKAHANGEFKGMSDVYWSTKDGYDAEKSELYKVLDAMSYDGIIFDKKAYRIEEGTYIKRGDYNYGDKQTWLNPFTSPETDNDYFREVHAVDTDLEWDEGDFRTESYRNDGTTAYQRHDVPNTESSFIKEFQDEYKAKKEELQKKEQEAATSTAGTTNITSYGSGGGNRYSSNSYSSGGSGGSSANYSPKIYNMKGGSLSVNKPASMYTKTPYSANKSYLSPDFQTAGSRNAYKRSEY